MSDGQEIDTNVVTLLDRKKCGHNMEWKKAYGLEQKSLR